VSTTDRIVSIELQFQDRQRLVVTCDAPRVRSDGGAILLRQPGERLSLTRTFAELLEDNGDLGRWLSYAAETWSRERVIVLEVEHSERGENRASSSRP
jgi:hypothetical protein